jgi:leucyl aminopeptidase
MSEFRTNARDIKDAGKARTHCAVLPVFSDGKRTRLQQQLDSVTGGAISTTIKLGDFSGKKGETALLTGNSDVKRVLLVGAGKEQDFDRAAARSLCSSLIKGLKATTAGDAIVYGRDLPLKTADAEWFADFLGREAVTATYQYATTLSKPKPAAKLGRLVLDLGKNLATARTKQALDAGAKTGAGVNEARELANLPGNICTPEYLAQRARRLARGSERLSVKVLNEKQMKELGMGSFLSVSAGSATPPRMIIIEYKGGKRSGKPQVLVGKGITFDSGGISLKPGAKMDEMKFDMGGAASVLGTLAAVKALELPINLIGIIAAAENMPSGTATKPGDVVTSMSGKTIEILNTDAEGRLVLADALTYAERYEPAAVVDIATLTGACVVALGAHASGLYANDESLAEQLLEAGTESHDRAWRMPLWDDYQKQLDSNFADMANIGGPGGGSVTAACFLSRFAEKYAWAHLDIAGSAWDSSPKGATGRPVALLTRYLRDRAEKA